MKNSARRMGEAAPLVRLPRLVGVPACILLGLSLLGCGETHNCSSCGPGTYPSELSGSQWCSICTPCPEVVTDDLPAEAQIWCSGSQSDAGSLDAPMEEDAPEMDAPSE